MDKSNKPALVHSVDPRKNPDQGVLTALCGATGQLLSGDNEGVTCEKCQYAQVELGVSSGRPRTDREWFENFQHQMVVGNNGAQHQTTPFERALTRFLLSALPEELFRPASKIEMAALRKNMDAAITEILRLQANAKKTSENNALLKAENERLLTAMSQVNHDICQTLGKVLGYPWYKDDQKNFPGASAADGICEGDSVAESMAVEAAKKLQWYQDRVERLFAAIGHGDDKHRQWLKDAIGIHFNREAITDEHSKIVIAIQIEGLEKLEALQGVSHFPDPRLNLWGYEKTAGGHEVRDGHEMRFPAGWRVFNRNDNFKVHCSYEQLAIEIVSNHNKKVMDKWRQEQNIKR